MRRGYIKPTIQVELTYLEDTISNASSYITGGGEGAQMIQVEDWTDAGSGENDVSGTNPYVF